MAVGCPERIEWEFLKYVWRYPARQRPKVLALTAAVRADQTAIVLRSPAAVRTFEAGLSSALELA
jgi:hypothetical protein